MVDFIQYTLNGTLIGLLYALIALAFIVIYRSSRILNLAQGEVVVLGGFVVYTFMVQLSLSIWIALPFSLATVLILGFLIEKGIFRHLIGESLFTNVMVTIGLMIFLRGLMLVAWGPAPLLFPEVISSDPVTIGPFLFSRAILFGGVFSCLLFFCFHWLLEKTRWGLTMTAVAEDPVCAQSLGISVKRSVATAWALGFSLSTVAAIVFLSGQSIGFLASEIGLVALPVALLAGMESVWGAPVAGIIIGVGQALSQAYLDDYTAGTMSKAFPFIVMIIILLIRPQGLFGWKIIERV